ncbi:kinase-like domain-containing protein [Chytridium lagenaria]|nr:kinase-like domain-containing protein [Chytridium lagenaria]
MCKLSMIASTDSSEDKVQYLDVEIDHKKLLPGSAYVLKLAFPQWNVDEDVVLVQQTDGITKTYGLGSDILIDRKQELMRRIVFAPKDIQEVPAFSYKHELLNELQILKSHLDLLNSPIVFSHCDLLSANIIYSQKEHVINFIDYEYGQYNPRGFDIGNHFCEYAGFECHYEFYPNEEKQKMWLTWYLKSSNGSDPSSDDVDLIYAEVNKYALAAHMFWGVWALVQSKISDLDFDYASYAQLRFREYVRRKEEFFAL